MAGIKDAINDLLTKLQAVNGSTSFLYVRVWNNQFQLLDEGKTEAIPFPCAFVEVRVPNDYTTLPYGITQSDVTFRIHIGQREEDAGDGTMGQNINIFALRDEVIKLLTNYEPTACSGLMKVAEEQDYSHTNIYHYIVDFICAFIDNKGDTRTWIEKTPPTILQIDTTIE